MSGDRGTMIGRLREKRSMEEQGDSINIEEKGQLLKQTMFDCAKNVCQFTKTGRKNPESEWWNEEVKAAL